MIVLAGLPAFAYTAAINCPSGESELMTAFGDPFFVACVQTVFNAVVFPAMITSIVRKAYTHNQDLNSGVAIEMNQAKLFLSLVIELTSTMVSPVVASLLLDESCESLSLHLH